VTRVPTRLLCVTALLIAVSVATGCTTMRQVLGFKAQAAAAQAKVRIHGTIETEGPVEGTLVVFVAAPADFEDGSGIQVDGRMLVGVDSYSRANSGTFLFVLDAGRYRLGAYEDRNRNGILDPDESSSPTLASDAIVLAPGQRVEITIRLLDAQVHEGPSVDILGLVERDVRGQRRFALWAFSATGEVISSLAEERFGEHQGPYGLWRPIDFLNEELAGIYFLEAYDDERTPVLFVHGISGFPREFETLIGQLDTSRYQPWFYFYPSGIGLAETSNHLARLIRKLQIELDFDEIAIVAHSMGGLVARGAILHYVEDTGRNDIPIFITISSPFGGDVRASRTANARIAIPQSFKDMSPASDYLTWLFYENGDREVPKALPAETEHHMIIGYRGSGEPYNDGTVSIESQAHVETQEHATSLRVWNFSHVGILHEQRTADHIDQLLDEKF
jgi:pimeloyl-ACP methyl ester carboxylesterase